MAKLYFRYGAMGSSKTANALMVRYNYLEKGKVPLLLKPGLENRDGPTTIKSRIGLVAECKLVEDFIEQGNDLSNNKFDSIIIDESQFLLPKQVDFFAGLVDRLNIPVICYGLRTDFRSRLFPGSKRLMELADVIEEIPTICWCGKKAQFNARVSQGHVVRRGVQVEIGGNESYVSLCRKHYMNGQLSQ